MHHCHIKDAGESIASLYLRYNQVDKITIINNNEEQPKGTDWKTDKVKHQRSANSTRPTVMDGNVGPEDKKCQKPEQRRQNISMATEHTLDTDIVLRTAKSLRS